MPPDPHEDPDDGLLPSCVFCQRIAAGDFDMHYKHLDVVTFEPLNPVTPGHRLFLPARHFEHPYHGAVADAMAAAALSCRKGDQYNLITSSGPDATQTIAHIHVHLVPRRAGDGLALPWTGQKPLTPAGDPR